MNRIEALGSVDVFVAEPWESWWEVDKGQRWKRCSSVRVEPVAGVNPVGEGVHVWYAKPAPGSTERTMYGSSAHAGEACAAADAALVRLGWVLRGSEWTP